MEEGEKETTPLMVSKHIKSVTGGVADTVAGLKSGRAFLHRMLLWHIVRHDYPFYRVGRLLLGVSICLLVNIGTRCLDNLTAVFNFFLCVSSDENGVVDVREVAVGGLIGTAIGALFQLMTIAASGTYEVGSLLCSSANATLAAQNLQRYQWMYQWNSVWSIAIGVGLTYYALHVLRLEGPDYMQLGTAVISVLVMTMIDFPYLPLLPHLPTCSILTPVIQNVVTRLLALACACVVALVFWAGFSVWVQCANRCKARRREDRFWHSEPQL